MGKAAGNRQKQASHAEKEEEREKHSFLAGKERDGRVNRERQTKRKRE